MAKLIRKSGFKLRDEVYFDNFEKEGVITTISKDKLNIFTDASILFRSPQVVYKKSETLGCGHWDTLTKSEKIDILNKVKVSKDLARRDWQDIPGAIKKAIYKAEGSGELSPTGINTDTQNVYNPVTSNRTVSDRIKEELEEQSKEEEKKSDEPVEKINFIEENH